MPFGIGGEVGWWCPSLDDAGNGTATLNGLIGSNNGTLTNMDPATDWVANTDNGGIRALDLDGVNDRIQLGSVPFTGTGSLSISMWFRQATARVDDHLIKFGTATLNNAVGIFKGNPAAGTNNKLVVGTHASSTSEAVSTTSIAANTWYFVGATISPTRREIFINGVLEGVSTNTVSYNITSTFANIGAAQSGLVPLGGLVDDIRVFNRVLTAAEFAALATKRGYQPPNTRRRRYSGSYGL